MNTFVKWIVLGTFGLASLGLAESPGQTHERAQAAKALIPRFESAETCASCHESQHREWQGSMMHYSAASPVFQAFELKTRKLTGRFGPHDRENPTFCINCHSPTAAYGNEMIGLLRDEASIHNMSSVAKEGISCTVCHSVRKPALNHIPEKGMLGDSLANADFVFYPTTKIVGPTVKEPLPKAVGFHTDGFSTYKKSSEYLVSSQFCGSCHNVNLPQKADSLAGTPFQVEQATFTEWEKSVYATDKNPFGRTVSCTDCHMSLYSSRDSQTGRDHEPGVYPVDTVAKGYDRKRKHALHRFTAASASLLETEELFPRQLTKQLDQYGMPMGQHALREQMLRKACSLKSKVQGHDSTSALLQIEITNTGAGHHVPTGLSQDRELWLEVTAAANGKPFFASGHLQDSAHPQTGELQPDTRVNDEDLRDVEWDLDPRTLEIRKARMGWDFNLRPFAPRGVPRFSNGFLRKAGPSDYARVAFFALADHIDNTRSLPVLRPITVDYIVDFSGLAEIQPRYCGPVQITTRLLYRSFRPALLRALAQSEPSLLNEARIDRNEIVQMARVENVLEVCLAQSGHTASATSANVSVAEQSYSFERHQRIWRAFHAPAFWEDAQKQCKQSQCRLASVDDYDSLGLAEHVATPGENHDELFKARWASDVAESDDSRKTYTFGWKQERVQSRRVGSGSLERLPFFCVCEAAGEEP